jgi:type IV pilus assembly protein PilB
MVGEIRDSETAKIAINSALTGHLVFSTLHTNNAAGTIPRLIDLGVNAKIISSALTVSIAQRLVRKLCEHCKVETVITGAEKDHIAKIVANIKRKRPDFAPQQMIKMWQPGKCEKCNNTGYKGRQGIFEAIVMDDAVGAVTVQNPNERDIKTAAIPQGILDMREDGIVKVLEGTTSLRELSRVIDLYEELI